MHKKTEISEINYSGTLINGHFSTMVTFFAPADVPYWYSVSARLCHCVNPTLQSEMEMAPRKYEKGPILAFYFYRHNTGIEFYEPSRGSKL